MGLTSQRLAVFATFLMEVCARDGTARTVAVSAFRYGGGSVGVGVRAALRVRGGAGSKGVDEVGASLEAMKVDGSQDGRNVETDSWLVELEAKLRNEVDAEGNPLSKNELKRRLKAAKTERERSTKRLLQEEKAVAAAEVAEAAGEGGAKEKDEEELDPTRYFENRVAAMSALEACPNTSNDSPTCA
jgi:hypothetical protein